MSAENNTGWVTARPWGGVPAGPGGSQQALGGVPAGPEAPHLLEGEVHELVRDRVVGFGLKDRAGVGERRRARGREGDPPASERTVISPPKHSEASWAESKDLTSASLKRYLRRAERGWRGCSCCPPPPPSRSTHHLLVL